MCLVAHNQMNHSEVAESLLASSMLSGMMHWVPVGRLAELSWASLCALDDDAEKWDEFYEISIAEFGLRGNTSTHSYRVCMHIIVDA